MSPPCARRDAGHGALHRASCDNLQGNGAITAPDGGRARAAERSGAGRLDRQACTFPNSMVDCIVPATGPAEIALARAFGIDDAAPVTHENFRQWVIEDDFCAGRPDWDRVGAILHRRRACLRGDEDPHPECGHQVLANAGELCRCRPLPIAWRPAIVAILCARCRPRRSCPCRCRAGHDAGGLCGPDRKPVSPIPRSATRRGAWPSTGRRAIRASSCRSCGTRWPPAAPIGPNGLRWWRRSGRACALGHAGGRHAPSNRTIRNGREGARRAAGAAPCRQPQPWPRMPWCPANRALHPWRAVAPLRRNRPAPPEFPRAASPARTLPGARPGGRPPRGGRCPMLSATAPGQSASPGAASRSRRGRGGGAGGGPAAMSHAHCSLV
jgi:hypothetical protein